MSRSTTGFSALLVLGCVLAASGFTSPLQASILRFSPLRDVATASTSAAAASASPSFSRTAVIAMEESTTPTASKITIRKPGEAKAADSSGGTKVSVRVRSPEERKAAQAATDAAAPADAAAATDDSSMKVSVKVKAPAAKKEETIKGGYEIAKLSEADKLLLEGTQKANCTTMIRALQDGANPNTQDPNGRTPLHFVAGLGLAPAAVILIHFGAQLEARDKDGLTPMHMASGYANAQVLRVLVQAGASTDVVGKQQGKPVEVVVALGDYQLSQFRNRTGADKLKKKDDKLEKLKSCLDVLDNVEDVRSEQTWEEIVEEVMICISPDAGN